MSTQGRQAVATGGTRDPMPSVAHSLSRVVPLRSDRAGRGVRLTGYEEALSAPIARSEPSQSRMVLLLLLSDRLTVDCGRSAVHLDRPGAFVVPAGSGVAHTLHPGHVSCIEVSLPPWGLTTILGARGPCPGQIVTAEDLIGADARRLLDRVGDGPTPQARLARLAACLRARSRRVDWTPRREIGFAWSCLVRSGGTMPVSVLAATVGWSERHLATQFRNTTGLLPKAAARQLRFDRAYRQVMRTSHPLATIAVRCGFADQAHMTRDFLHHVGCSPTTVRRTRPGTPEASAAG